MRGPDLRSAHSAPGDSTCLLMFCVQDSLSPPSLGPVCKNLDGRQNSCSVTEARTQGP